MRHKSGDTFIDTDATQEASTVEWMEARVDKLGRVADVVQPGSRDQYVRIMADNGGHSLSGRGHGLDVVPASRKGTR
jgi:hypothetical protein